MTILYDTHVSRWCAAALVAILMAWGAACGGSPAAPTPPPPPPPPAPTPDPPALTCPADAAAQSPNGQPITVTLDAPTVQGGAPPVAVTCDAPEAFPVGTTTVSCTAADALNRTASCSYAVTVTAVPPPPTLACPANITTQSPDGQPVPVSFQTPSPAGGAPPVRVSCNAPARFPVGTTSVTCTATDALTRSASCGFAVRVLSPPQLSVTKFLAFGDSLTAGEVSLSSVVLFLSPTDAYPYRLQTKLQARYRAQTISVINAGVPAELATEDGIARFSSEIFRHRPDVALIMEGTNDLPWRSADRIASALADMVRDAKQRGVRPMLATIPPARPGGRREGLPELIAVFNDQVRALARREGVTLVDVHAGMNLSLIGRDDLHPTPEGYEVMAQIFYAAIVAALDVPQAVAGSR